MREIIKECEKIFNEYGAICFAIAFIILSMFIMSWLVVCGIVYVFTFICQIPFSWNASTIVWVICIITLKICKDRINKEIEELEKLNRELGLYEEVE